MEVRILLGPHLEVTRIHFLLYDGVCGLCNRMNQFVLRRDPGDKFRFVPLQSALARRTLTSYGRDSNDLDTFYVVADHGEK